MTFPAAWRMRSYRLAASAALVLAHAGLALAQPARAEIGLLTCGLVQSEPAQGGTDATSLRQTWQLLCAFRPTSGGAEETYTGMLQSVGLEKELSERRAIIWVVKGFAATVGSPGLLQQAYAADLAANPGQAPPLIGETNVSIVLQTMADAQLAGLEKQHATIAMIVVVTLTLKSTPA